MSVAAAKHVLSDEVIFTDGLGDRVLLRDAHGRPEHECLVLRGELSSVPAFQLAVSERLTQVAGFDHPAFLTARRIDQGTGSLPRVSLLSDHAEGVRLSHVLDRAATGGKPVSAGAAVFVIKEILDGVAALHRMGGDLSHGALAPERIVLAGGKVRIADYVLGTAVEQLRYSSERYWKDLRVAVPASAGDSRFDRRVDVAQVGMIALALFAGRPLTDSEHPGALDALLARTPLEAPIRGWLLKALSMDSRRVFLSAAEASQSLVAAMDSAGLHPAPGDLDLQSPRPAAAAGPLKAALPVAKALAIATAPPARPELPLLRPAISHPEGDVWEGPDVDPLPDSRGGLLKTIARVPMRPGFRTFLWAAKLMAAMAGAFTAAQFIPAPDWVFSSTGTLVVESNPQGAEVLVNGTLQGVTPLTLRVESGRHEVELRGPGRPRIFNVYVSRGDRVAQYVEFPARPR